MPSLRSLYFQSFIYGPIEREARQRKIEPRELLEKMIMDWHEEGRSPVNLLHWKKRKGKSALDVIQIEKNVNDLLMGMARQNQLTTGDMVASMLVEELGLDVSRVRSLGYNAEASVGWRR